MTIGQAATRLRVDSSTVGKYIREGIERRGGRVLFLPAVRVVNPKTKRRRYEISATQLHVFARARRASR